MKILHKVELYYPSRGDMQKLAKQIYGRSVKIDHKATITITKLS